MKGLVKVEQVRQISKLNINQSRFGFSFEKGSAHLSRTMMLEELRFLLDHVSNPNASKNDYIKAICNDNCLRKRSVRTRTLSVRYLSDLYALDTSVTIFRIFLFFWYRDKEGQSLLALLCSCSRDSILHMSAPFILSCSSGVPVSRESIEDFIEIQSPGRFSKATLKSTAQNIRSTWTQSGHLKGCVKKIRSNPIATPGSVSYALFLGYLGGARGKNLFETEYIKILDCSSERSIELAEESSKRGWIVFKRIRDVMEVSFPNLLKDHEMEWLREQS